MKFQNIFTQKIKNSNSWSWGFHRIPFDAWQRYTRIFHKAGAANNDQSKFFIYPWMFAENCLLLSLINMICWCQILLQILKILNIKIVQSANANSLCKKLQHSISLLG